LIVFRRHWRDLRDKSIRFSFSSLRFLRLFAAIRHAPS
jgi:hypothetical protein